MIELKLIQNFPQEIIALDEVGRSPLCGPVVIGGVRVVVEDYDSLISLLRSFRRIGVKDSKQLTHEKRELLLKKLQIKDLTFGEKGSFSWKGLEISYVTWSMDHHVIDSENIFEASMRGMKEAAISLQNGDVLKTSVLIDGQSKLRWKEEALAWKEITIVKGDVKSALIGLASIIAKEKRDDFMRKMHLIYPHYGLDKNFGYPTVFHRKAIEERGPCEIHRKSFGKVKEFVPSKVVG